MSWEQLLKVAGDLGPFPIVKATATSSNAGTASHTITLPSGVQDNDLLIGVLISNVSLQQTHTWPGSWTEMYETNAGGLVWSVAYKVASSEGASITVTTPGSSGASVALTYCIYNYSSTPEAATEASGSGTTPNPPSLTPSWGSNDTLWLAIVVAEIAGGGASFSAAPSGYENLVQLEHPTADPAPIVAGAEIKLTATSEDPGAFTSSSMAWRANTIAIKPA